MAQWDLSAKIAPFLDMHLTLHILNFIGERCEEEDAAAAEDPNYGPRKWYRTEDVLKAKYEAAMKTGMCDFVVELWKQMHGEDHDPPQNLLDRRNQVITQMRSVQAGCVDFLKEFSSAGSPANLEKVNGLRDKGQFTIEYLKQHYPWMSDKTVGTLYEFGKCQYEVSRYPVAAEALFYCRLLSTSQTPSPRDVSAMWGKLVAEILNQNWETADADRKMLKDLLDKGNNPTSRAWLMHWSLFIFFNHAPAREGKDCILEMFFMDKFLVALQLCAPHLLRYVATAVVISKKKDRRKMMDLVKILEAEKHSYSDPITEFLRCLYLRCDFDGAQEKLKQCREVLLNDFFLVECCDLFEEQARQLVFSDYCRAHNAVDIQMVAEKLGMELEKAEGWIVNLIRDARLDACIDSQATQVIMSQPQRSVYQRVEEQAKALTFRTESLITQIQDKRGALDGIL